MRHSYWHQLSYEDTMKLRDKESVATDAAYVASQAIPTGIDDDGFASALFSEGKKFSLKKS